MTVISVLCIVFSVINFGKSMYDAVQDRYDKATYDFLWSIVMLGITQIH